MAQNLSRVKLCAVFWNTLYI